MCGIYGFAGMFPDPNLLMKSLTIMNIPRGEDSFGIFTATGRVPSEFKHRKSVQGVTDWVLSDEFSELTNDPLANVMVGHNRFATVGKVTRSNAHPFHVGDTIGVHNGTVENLETVRKATGKNYAVDSKHLIHLLDKNGNVGPAYGKINLAYCQRKDSANLRLIRHGHPLHYATPYDNQQWFVFSSEEHHLEQALALCGYQYGLDYDLDCMVNNTSLAVYLNDNNFVNDIQIADEKVRHWVAPKNNWSRPLGDVYIKKPYEKGDYYISDLYDMDKDIDAPF